VTTATRVQPHYVDTPSDVQHVARALAGGAVVAVAFGNFYVIVTSPAADVVRGVNIAKGRPADQVGSITTAAHRIPAMFDWSQLPDSVPEQRIRALMDVLYGYGPFGFRGPADGHVPDHLTQTDRGIRTTQVIAPGGACPSNVFFEQAVAALGTQLLYITSANRSRHLTGAAEEPAHWRADGIAEDFAHLPELAILRHRDEAAARALYPAFAPTSVTLLSFHHAAAGRPGRTVLTIDRHGSLPLSEVRAIAEPFGFDIVLGPTAQRRLQVRDYGPAMTP
jgi:hypothetical protein